MLWGRTTPTLGKLRQKIGKLRQNIERRRNILLWQHNTTTKHQELTCMNLLLGLGKVKLCWLPFCYHICQSKVELDSCLKIIDCQNKLHMLCGMFLFSLNLYRIYVTVDPG